MKKILLTIIVASISLYSVFKLLDSVVEAPKVAEKSARNLIQFLHLSQFIPACMNEFKASSSYTNLPYKEQSKVDETLYNDVNKTISLGMAACATERYVVSIELAFSSAKTIYLPSRIGAIDTILGELNGELERSCAKAVNLINLYCPANARMVEFD